MDFEAEFNNRAMVPEFPEIFARWEHDSTSYRKGADMAGRADLDVSYGTAPQNSDLKNSDLAARQKYDVFLPQGYSRDAGEKRPYAVFIHGGYWRALDRKLFSHMATGLNAAGYRVIMPSYPLCPMVSILEIIDIFRGLMRDLYHTHGRPALVYGHSAGGHLAMAMLATNWQAFDKTLPPDLITHGASLSGLFDLVPLMNTSMNADLRLDVRIAEAASPLFWPMPQGKHLWLAAGGAESDEFQRQSRMMASVARQNGLHVEEHNIAGANHFTLVDPLSDARSQMSQDLLKFIGG